MKTIIILFLHIYFFVLPVEIFSQSGCLDSLKENQRMVYLYGNEFYPIDNALRCFGLSSIGQYPEDTLIRIWLQQEGDVVDSPLTWTIKMFEFGKNYKGIPSASLNVLKWSRDSSFFPVTCIQQKKIYPLNGWLAFEKDIRRLNLTLLYQNPLSKVPGTSQVNDGDMLTIQYLFGNNTYTVDFRSYFDLNENGNKIQYNYSVKLVYLFYYIKKHFGINLSLDSKGYDFLEGILEGLREKAK